MSIIATPVSSAASSSAATTSSAGADSTMIASNFQTFLTLLTTQLKNQNPLDPLDTNQFTQQLVQFAQVEQQMKSNDQLTSLVALEKSAASTTALAFVGATVAVDGQTAPLDERGATWAFTSPKPASAMITVTDSTGQTAFSGNFTLQAGELAFTWDGKGNNGQQWPKGNYKMTISAKDASGAAVAVATEVEGAVDSVDLSKDPPTLSIGGQNFTIDKVKRVIRPPA